MGIIGQYSVNSVGFNTELQSAVNDFKQEKDSLPDLNLNKGASHKNNTTNQQSFNKVEVPVRT